MDVPSAVAYKRHRAAPDLCNNAVRHYDRGALKRLSMYVACRRNFVDKRTQLGAVVAVCASHDGTDRNAIGLFEENRVTGPIFARVSCQKRQGVCNCVWKIDLAGVEQIARERFAQFVLHTDRCTK